jgi:hypothetical protein
MVLSSRELPHKYFVEAISTLSGPESESGGRAGRDVLAYINGYLGTWVLVRGDGQPARWAHRDNLIIVWNCQGGRLKKQCIR